MRLQLPLLVLCSVLAGYVFATHNTASAAGGGGWQCYVVDRLPDIQKAMDWKGATNVTEGLNATSPSSPAGTILSVQYPTAGPGWTGGGSSRGDVGLICIKG